MSSYLPLSHPHPSAKKRSLVGLALFAGLALLCIIAYGSLSSRVGQVRRQQEGQAALQAALEAGLRAQLDAMRANVTSAMAASSLALTTGVDAKVGPAAASSWGGGG